MSAQTVARRGRSTEYGVPSTEYRVRSTEYASSPPEECLSFRWAPRTPYSVLRTLYSVLRTPYSPPAPPTPARPRRWWAYLLAVLLAGYLLFAHGCHGDEDNELFAAAPRSGATKTG
jgi:hypothetical protein